MSRLREFIICTLPVWIVVILLCLVFLTYTPQAAALQRFVRISYDKMDDWGNDHVEVVKDSLYPDKCRAMFVFKTGYGAGVTSWEVPCR